MRVIAKKTLRDFWETHPDAEPSLRAWHAEAAKALWAGPQDVRAKYASASFVGGDRVVFNISGNKYRLIVAIKYSAKIVYIRFVGTHSDYDDVIAEEV